VVDRNEVRTLALALPEAHEEAPNRLAATVELD